MAAPITWQTINGPSPAQAAVPMESAARLILGGFDRAGATLDGYNKQQQGIEDRSAEANIQGFLERLQRAQSVEDVAALRSSGELDTLRAGLRPQDLAKVRGAEDDRLSTLMNQVASKNTFDDTIRSRAEDPIKEQYRVAVLNRDETAQKAIRDANPQIRGWDKLLADEQVTERRFVTQDREDLLAPYTVANTIAESKLKGVQLKNAERANNDAEEERRLTDRLATAQQEYLKQQSVREAELGKVAKRLGYPVDSSGFAKVNEMTEEQMLRLNNEAILSGIPTSDQVRGSDTKTADEYLKRLTNSGEFSPRTLLKNRDTIRGAFATNGLSPAVGNDAATIALDRAREKVVMDERAKDNWSAPGSPDARRNYEELAKDVPALLDKTTGFGVAEDVLPIQNLLTDLAVNGLKVKINGKEVAVTPSANDVRAAIRGAKGGWINDDARADNVRKELEKIMNSPTSLKRLAEAEDLKVFQRKEAVRGILNSK